MHFDLSVVIPAYNEELRLEATLLDITNFLQTTELSYEILVIDDGSTDGTVSLAKRIARSVRNLRVVETNPNRGKGHAVRVGMLAARGNVRLMCDADGSMPAAEIPKLVNPVVLGEADIAIGSRYADGASSNHAQPVFRRLWSRFANRVVQRTLVPGIRDTQCGFKVFSAKAARDVFSRARINGWAFDLEALALASRLGFSIQEVAVHWDDDPRSRINPLRDAWRVVTEWAAIRRNFRRQLYGALPAPPPRAALKIGPAAWQPGPRRHSSKSRDRLVA